LTDAGTAATVTPDERRFSSIVRISTSESRRATSACNSRRCGAGGFWRGGLGSEQKAGDEGGVQALGLGAREVTLRVGFNGRRVEETQAVIVAMEVGGERVAVSAGGFEAGVHLLDPLAAQPVGELGQAVRVVRQDLVAELALRRQEAGVELELGEIEAERR
jgi:hypothetical protein